MIIFSQIMSKSIPAEELDGADMLAEDDVIEHIPQEVDSKKLLGDGWEFAAPKTIENEADLGAGDSADKKQHFEGLAKLSEDGHSLAEYCQAMGLDDDDADTRQPFAILRTKMTDLLGDGGVMKWVKVPGAGLQVPPGSRVTVHYVGQFEGFDEPFDSTYMRNRGRPETHLVGENSQLLPGLNHAILSMKKGETALALISPDYAFGKLGCGPRIPPESEVLFEVTLVSFTDSSDADEFDELTEEQQKRATFEQRIRAIRAHHNKGNDEYKRGEFAQAARSYRDAIRVFLVNMSFKNEEEHREAKHVIFKVMSNRVQALLQMAQWKEAAKQGRQALHYEDAAGDPDLQRKLYTRLAKAMIYIPEFEEASRLLKRAERLKPRCRDVIVLTELLASRQKADKLLEVEFARRAFQPEQRSEQKPAGDGAPAEGRTNLEQPSSVPDAAGDTPDPNDAGEIRVSDEFRRDVERTLRLFLSDPSRRELALPLNQSEQGRHKLAHICVRCRELGLQFVGVEDGGRPRVVKTD
ncbi:Inactive peptidyl-prolyl cis-trans isomerase FKBP6 [Amphibalanus amphitrite]|uniref:peptidylprolyl isomerase n=2 Tax=Amphibalanus amphitrite TaxID=1232801 RepID=A0A6A4WGX4_AMPAM|nr:Inactive peptidyl-prolyl cis-trans isomerase FKBP6 [Amphibalanus amphitrite]